MGRSSSYSLELSPTALLWLSALLVSSFSVVTEAMPLSGVVQLDTYSFNKTATAFPYALVKFDVGYPTGDMHRMWGDLGRDLVDAQDVLVAEVRIKDYGDRANQELGERFGLETKEMLPQVILFKKKGRRLEEVRYGADMDKDEILTFLRHKTGMYLNLPGTLRKYDSVARWFLKAENPVEREKIVEKAESQAEKEKKEETRIKARKYAKVMRMVASRGNDALDSEKERLLRLLEGEGTSKEKKEDLEATLNVVKAFLRLRDPREQREEEKREEEEKKKKTKEEDGEDDDSDDEEGEEKGKNAREEL